MDFSQLTISSFNMHDFKSGASELSELWLCRSVGLGQTILTILIQLAFNFNFNVASSMFNAVGQRFIKGRPFGGVGLIWHKNLNHHMQLIRSDPEDRRIAMRLNMQLIRSDPDDRSIAMRPYLAKIYSAYEYLSSSF